MVLKIKNLNKNLNKNLEYKINRCITLLGNEYISLDFTIDFYKNKERLELEKANNPILNKEQYEQILSGKNPTSGITIAEHNKISIFLFLFDKNLETNPSEIINLIGNIYHELRHAWQAKNHLFEDEPEISTIDGSFYDYLRLPSEKDAYIFQEEQMNKHLRTILNIFGYRINQRLPPYKLKDNIRSIIYS